MRVLIVDDDRALGESLVELITSRGYEAYYAASVEDAMWHAGLFRFSLALVDFDLPELTGPEVASRLTALDPHLKTVVMSAREVTPERRNALGTLAFLKKPLGTDALCAFLDHLVLQASGSSLVRRVSFALRRYTPRHD